MKQRQKRELRRKGDIKVVLRSVKLSLLMQVKEAKGKGKKETAEKAGRSKERQQRQ